jgi:uncharacterized protein YukE
MSDAALRSRLIRLAAANPELRAEILPLLKEQADPASHDQNKPESYYGLPPKGVQASRHTAMDFPSEAALKQYLRDHPKADKSKHRVRKDPSYAKHHEKVKGGITDKFNDITKHMSDAGVDEDAFFTDKDLAGLARDWAKVTTTDFQEAQKGNDREKLNAVNKSMGEIANKIKSRVTELSKSKKTAGTRRKAHGPVAIRQPEVMLYAIDPDASAQGQSKFYEMKVVPFGAVVDVVRPTVRKEKDFRARGVGGFTLVKRWGRLTDSGSAGRVDAMDEYYDTEQDARAAMDDTKRSKARGGGSAKYTDVSRTREYPIGLGGSGFGWGGQQACTFVPELRQLQQAVTTMNTTIASTGGPIRGLAEKNSDVGRRVSALLGELQGTLGSLQQYLDGQLRHC